MVHNYRVKPRPRSAYVPDALRVSENGRVTSYRTGLAERGFDSLELALAEYSLTSDDLEPTEDVHRFSERSEPGSKP